MTVTLVVFFALGACFGLITYSQRHLFSEGPTRRAEERKPNLMDGRLMWTLICTMLWPIMVLTGLHSWWILARRRAVAARKTQD